LHLNFEKDPIHPSPLGPSILTTSSSGPRRHRRPLKT
jgi:hypothetical protein